MIGSLYRDAESFESYNFIDEPVFVHEYYHFNRFINRLRTIYSLPKYKKREINLKNEVSRYCEVAKFFVKYNRR